MSSLMRKQKILLPNILNFPFAKQSAFPITTTLTAFAVVSEESNFFLSEIVATIYDPVELLVPISPCSAPYQVHQIHVGTSLSTFRQDIFSGDIMETVYRR
jgi:hypothetical protein